MNRREFLGKLFLFSGLLCFPKIKIGKLPVIYIYSVGSLEYFPVSFASERDKELKSNSSSYLPLVRK